MASPVIKNFDDIETVALTKVKRVILQRFSKEFLLDVEAWKDELFDDLIIRATESQLALKAGSRIIKHPENWKEAFKERWFPGWLQKQFPVKYQEYDALVMFPKILKKFPVPQGVANQEYYFTYTRPGEVLPK